MEDYSNKHYYEVLEIPVDATHQQIKSAYELAVQTFDPESIAVYSLLAADEDTTEILHQVHKAYCVLSDPVSRAHYNQELNLEPPPEMEDLTPNDALVQSDAASNVPENQELSQSPSISDIFKNRTDEREGNRDSIHEKNKNSQTTVNQFITEVVCFDGHTLQRIREMKAIDLEEMAKETCVRKVFLQAIEEENFEDLPKTEIYLKNYITHYAQCLELPTAQVLNDYLPRMHASV